MPEKMARTPASPRSGFASSISDFWSEVMVLPSGAVSRSVQAVKTVDATARLAKIYLFIFTVIIMFKSCS